MLATWMAACARRPARTLAAALLLAAASLFLAATRLDVTTDTSNLFSASLPWRQRGMVLQQAFPQNEGLLALVIDAATPEEAEATAQSLLERLQADRAHFESARRPDSSPYFEQNGLLFLDPAPLQALLDQTIDAQPFLGQLAPDPSLRGLAGALGLIAQGLEAGQVNLAPFDPALQSFHRSLAQAIAGAPEPLSWQRLLAGPVADLGGRFHFVLAKPVLDYGALEPGAAASKAARDAAATLEFVRNGRAHIRLTGSVALEDEEFATVAQGAAAGLLGSMLLLAGLLFLAVRSWRLMVPILLTLILGLILTTGFAALAVGTLNLVSIAFAVLFTGIAVDFAIQVTVRFRAALQSACADPVAAIQRTGEHAANQVLVAALASMAGFLAFTPTSFEGVAQLGLIAGSGMLIAFACTVTVLPALLVAFRPRAGAAEAGLRWLGALDPVLQRRRRPVVAAFALLAAAGLASLPFLAFDSDPLHTKNSNTEAMRTLYDLMDDPIANPYTMEILTPSVAAATALAARLRPLPLVGEVIGLNSFVPEDQQAKLTLVADAASLLRATLAPTPGWTRPTPADLRAAVAAVAKSLEAVSGKPEATQAIRAVTADLAALAKAPDATLLAADSALTRFLPLQLARLRQALDARPTTIVDVPEEISRDWLLPDGRAKLQIVPKPEGRSSEGLHRFVAQVQTVAPEAAGSALTITASADTITAAFRTAGLLAFAAITVLLAVVLRRAVDVALVLAPLLVSSLLTVLLAVLLPLPLNFANVIALPLLLGVGVSFNVYFVMNRRNGATAPLGSATARGILFSALTTSAAFGSLAISPHPGTASMGRLLLLSLACTALATLIFLPALLAWSGPVTPARTAAAPPHARPPAR